MYFKHKLIQCNCRSLNHNYSDVLLLLNLLSPSVLCLQETFLKLEDDIPLKGFNSYNYIYTEGHKACGGTSILVKSSCPQRQIKLNTNNNVK